VFYEYTESDHPRDWPSRQQLRVAHGRLFRTPKLFHVEQFRDLPSRLEPRADCIGYHQLFHVEQLYRPSPVFMRVCAVFPLDG
jgi:hypothetical protein